MNATGEQKATAVSAENEKGKEMLNDIFKNS